jgi:hypothetical protein
LQNRLSGSIETAFLGTLLWAHHPALFQLLFNTGTIYEIFCFLFYFAALACYVHWRRQGILSWARAAGVLGLAALALNSKEMAVTLPVALLLFELIYHWAERWTRVVIATALLTVVVMAVKLATYNPLSRDPRYHISISASGVIEALCRYFDSLTYREAFLTPVGLLVICAGMLALAHALRSRPMKFGFWFLLISLMPVCIIPIFRNGFMLYIPMIGWALYWGALWTRAWQFVASRLPKNTGVAIRATALVAIAVLIVTAHSAKRSRYVEAMRVEQHVPRRMIRQLKELRPRLEPGAQLLILDDALPLSDWSLLLFTQLAYADPGIWVDRAKMLGAQPDANEMTLYDHVFTDRDGVLREIPNPAHVAAAGPPIEVHFEPALVHPGENYEVSVPEWPEETLDIEYEETRRTVGHAGLGRKWCHLDARGKAIEPTPNDIPAGRISIRRIRTQHGVWLPASGVLTVVR